MKGRNRSILAVCLLLLVLTTFGCAGEDTYRLFFADTELSQEERSPFTGFAKAVERTGDLPDTDEERILFLLEELAKGPRSEEKGLAGAVPPDTEVRSVSVEEGTARVDLSSAVYEGEGAWDRPGLAFMDTIILTLTQEPTIILVQVTVEGEPWDDGCFLWDRPIGQFEILPAS
jgi:hypothetical protein